MDPGALPPQLNDGEATLAALQRSLQEADQHRLDMARRLHRDVAGNLVACSALSEMVRSQLGAANGNAADMAATLGRIDAAVRDALQVVRSLTEEQFPPVLTAFGLNAALQQFVKTTVGGFSCALILNVDEDELGLEPARRLNLFRILQVMIRRCMCDSRATVVEVNCVASPRHIDCTIDYDGDPELWSAAARADEIALIRARCRLLGCEFRTSPSPTGGAPRVTLLVPDAARPA
jgi:signal transduction histidine kinase